MVRFYLESLVEGGRQLRRIAVHPLPFRVGRLHGLSLYLASESVSKEHAEIESREGVLWVRDLGSKNGTFVRGRRISGPAELSDGDELCLGSLLLVFRRDSAPRSTETESV